MAAFFRGLLLFLFGALVGVGGVLFFAPNFSVVISRGAPAAKPAELVVAPPLVPPMVPAKPAEAPSPAAVKAPVAAVTAAAAPSAEAAPEASLDFKSISEHLILWPNTVTVKAATTVPVLVDGKKVQDLALEAGTVLQVSKVLADGSLEARAKGAKFEIKSSLTDFTAELGKRVAELVAKGTKFDSPYPSGAPAAPMAPVASAPAASAPVASSAPAAPAVAPAAPRSWSSLTLAQRVDILFGNNKPDAPATPSAAAPAAPAVVAPAASAPAPAAVAPAAEAAPAAMAPAADPKTAEKGKDLDRKMNQLFK